MAKQKAEANEQNKTVDNLPVVVHAQYVKDFSFENPNTPEVLRAGLKAPKMDVNIGMDARKIPDEKIADMYEVVLSIGAKAERDDKPVFLVELHYGVTVSLNGVPEEQHHPMLLIEIPRLAFPFARQILADITTQGGYPPLLLNPVDFHALYMSRFGEELRKAQEEALQSA